MYILVSSAIFQYKVFFFCIFEVFWKSLSGKRPKNRKIKMKRKEEGHNEKIYNEDKIYIVIKNYLIICKANPFFSSYFDLSPGFDIVYWKF